MKKESINKKRTPTQGFNTGGKFGDCKTNSTHNLGPNNMKPQGNPSANIWSGKYVRLVISLIVFFDKLAKVIINPTACSNKNEQILLEISFLGVVVIAPVLFLGAPYFLLILLPIIVYFNAFRHAVMELIEEPPNVLVTGCVVPVQISRDLFENSPCNTSPVNLIVKIISIAKSRLRSQT